MNRKKALLIIVVTFLVTSMLLAIVQPGLIKEVLTTSSLIDSKYQQVDYATNERGTLINVPLDSRPVGRDNVENLAIAAGYDYYEISSGLDSASGDSIYYSGNPTSIQNSLKSTVKKHNNSDTTVIINGSSYFNGGLLATRNPDSYANMDSKITALKDVIDTYDKANYYVIFQVPRTIPDERVLPFPKGITSTTKVDGLEAYYNKSVGKAAVQETFEQALLNWSYIYFYKLTHYSNPQATYVMDFYNDFYQKYQTYLDDYVAIYNQSYAYLNQLYIMKNQSYDFRMIVASDYYVTSSFIANNAGKSGFSWIKTDSNGKAIPYGGTQYVAEFAEIYTITFGAPVVSGLDTTTSLVLAADLVRRNGNGIDFNFSNPLTNGGFDSAFKNQRSYYDRKTNYNLLTEKSEFINRYVRNATLDTDVYVVDSYITDITTANANRMANNIYENVEDGNNTTVIDLATGKFDVDLFNSLITKSDDTTSIYDLVYCGGFNYAGTSLDLALATATVYAILEQDIKEADSINSFTKDRITAYNRLKFSAVSTDIVYNTLVRMQENYKTSLATKVTRSTGNVNSGVNLLTLFQSKDYTIADYTYSFSKVSVSATNPWNRAFDLKLTPTLSGLTVEKIVEEVPVTKISLNRTQLTVDSSDIGDTYQLSATITPSNATDKTVTWDSSKPTVASVNSSGRVTFRGVGTTTITATSSNGKQATCKIVIEKEVENSYPEISFDRYQTAWTNEDILIKMTITDDLYDISSVTVNGTKIISSSNRYSFYAKTNGTFQIIAKNEQGNSTTKNISINNIDKVLPTISIEGANQLYDNNPFQVVIKAFDADSGIKSLTVNEQNVTTSNGTVYYTINSGGKYTVVATDNAGNTRTSYFTIDTKVSIPKDVTPPTLVVTGAPTSWTNKDVTLTVNATDAGSGIKTVTVNGQEISISNGIGRYKVTKNGTYSFVATDNEGNTSTYNLTISLINKTVPTVANIENNKTYTDSVTPRIGSSVAGIKSVVLKRNGVIVSNYQIGQTISENGSYELIITDLAENVTTVNFKIQKASTQQPGNDDKDNNTVNTNNENTNTNTNNNNNNTNNNNNNSNNNSNTNTNTDNRNENTGNTNTNTDNRNENTGNTNTNTNTDNKNENKDNSNSNTNTNKDDSDMNSNTDTNTNVDTGSNGSGSGITIGSGNKNAGSTNTKIDSNKPTSTSGNLDSTKATGKIPQTGDISAIDAMLAASAMTLVPASVVSFKRYRTKKK